jgi:hypothetical protein
MARHLSKSHGKRRSIDDLKNDINRLTQEHIESLKTQAFVAPTEQQIGEDKERLKLIREASADYLAAMEGLRKRMEGVNMTEKPSVTLPGKVEKVIEPVSDEPEKAEISIEGADPLYREIRIENSLKDTSGQEVHLKENDEVDITVEADDPSAPPDRKKEANQSSSQGPKRQTA